LTDGAHVGAPLAREDSEPVRPTPNLLGNYYLRGDLEAQIEAFVADYNHRRYHESIDNLTPANVYFGRAQTILLQRERIKHQTITQRRLQHQRQAA
jgi:transposase InsO family protein